MGKKGRAGPNPASSLKDRKKIKIKGEGICANPEMLETRKGNISELPSPTIPPNFHVNKEVWHLRRDFSAKTVETFATHGKGKEETSPGASWAILRRTILSEANLH